MSNFLAFNSSVHWASTVPEAQLSKDRSGPCPALRTQSHITAQRQSSQSTHGLSRLPDARLPKSALFLLQRTDPAKEREWLTCMFNRRLQISSSWGDCSCKAAVCVWVAQAGCSRGRARSLPALQAPHLLAQPYLHVDLGSPCGIRWGGGGKTTVSFTHRLSKPGAISLGLTEESSTLLELFNPCSAKPLCMPRAMTALVCKGGICRSVITLILPKATQEGWVILTER